MAVCVLSNQAIKEGTDPGFTCITNLLNASVKPCLVKQKEAEVEMEGMFKLKEQWKIKLCLPHICAREVFPSSFLRWQPNRSVSSNSLGVPTNNSLSYQNNHIEGVVQVKNVSTLASGSLSRTLNLWHIECEMHSLVY